MMAVEVSEQVAAFIRRQPPEPRRFLRLALRALEREKGDIKALEGPLNGFYRLRIRGYRIVFVRGVSMKGRDVIRCLVADRRDIIYEVFEQLLAERLKRPNARS